MLICIEIHRTCDFPGGGGVGSRPLSPSGSAHIYTEASAQKTNIHLHVCISRISHFIIHDYEVYVHRKTKIHNYDA